MPVCSDALDIEGWLRTSVLLSHSTLLLIHQYTYLEVFNVFIEDFKHTRSGG